jgi:hypothetical protein
MKPKFLARSFAAGGILAVILAFCAMQGPTGAQSSGGQVAAGQVSGTFTGPGSPPLRYGPLAGQNSCTFQESGVGPTDATVSNDGASWSATTISTMGGATQTQPFTPTSGTVYQISPVNAVYVQLAPDPTWGSQNATVTMRCSGAISNVVTTTSGGAGSNVTIVAPTDAGGNVKVVQPAPSATQQVGCDTAAHCPVNASQVTSPWVVTTPVPYPTCNAGTALCTFSLNPALPTIAPGNYPGFTIADPNGITFPAVAPTMTPAPLVSSMPVAALLYGQCGTTALMCPISASGQAATGSARNPLNVVLCNNTASTCQIVTGTGADAIANTAMGAMNVSGFGYTFNGTTWDRNRKDTYAAGPLWMTTGGALTASAPTNATTVIKASPGRLATLLVTTLGTGTFQCFDNASTGSGTIIGDFGASAAVGSVQTLNMPAANGITCVSAVSGPVVTVAYY